MTYFSTSQVRWVSPKNVWKSDKSWEPEKIWKGAGRISTTRAKMGLRPEFLSEHHQNWRAKRFWVLMTGVWRVFILATFNFTLYFLSFCQKNGHKLPEILKIGSKIKVHQNENPLNPSYKHSKVHYWPILVVFRQKLWPQSHFGPGRRYPISPFLENVT